MAEYLIDKAYLVALADAIRKKSGSSSKMTPSAMVSAINNLGDMTYTPQSSSTVINKTGELHTIQDTTFNSLANAIRNKAGISDKMTPHKMIDVVNGLNSAQAFAVFSADDNSLNFYKRVDVPKVGERFEGKTVTEVYAGIEKSKFTALNQVPWFKQYQSITKCIVVDEIKPMSTAFWFALTYMTVCDVSKLDTTSTYDMWNMFAAALRLYELKLGKNFTWQGELCYPPIQTAGYIPNADGKWYAASDGKGYAPADIPSNKADTYYAYPPQAFAVYSDDDKSLNFYKRFSVPKAGEQFDGRTATEVYPFDENKAETPWRNGGWQSLNRILSVSFKDVIKPVSTRAWFADMQYVTNIDVKLLDTSNVTDMSYMFDSMTDLLALDVSHFDTSKVTNMAYMFKSTYKLKSLNLSNFNTSNVTNMAYMFDQDSSRNPPLLSDINVSSFDTSNVTDMECMFSCVSCQELDVSSFDTSKVKIFEFMFGVCHDLTTIYASKNFIVNGKHYMFTRDKKLVGGKGTVHDDWPDYETGSDTDYIDSQYARIDNPPSAPGYFTEKTAFAIYSNDDKSLNFYKRAEIPKAGEQFEGKTVTEVYTGIESDFISSSRQLRAPDVSATSTFNTETITVTVMDKIYPINLAGWFNGFSKCKEFNLRLLDTSNVLSMYDMFHDCSSVASLDLSTFETSKCHDFKQMFLSCSNLTDLDVSSFDTTAADNDLAAMFGVLGSSSSALFICNNLKRIVVGDRFTAFKELPAPNGNYIPGADGKWYAVSDGKGYTPENIPSNKADTYVASKDLLPKVIVSNPVNAYTDLYHSPQF